MQSVDHGITPVLLRCIAGWKEDDRLPVHVVAFQIAFQCGAVNPDVFNCDRLCTGYYGRHHRLNLRHRHDGRTEGDPKDSEDSCVSIQSAACPSSEAIDRLDL